MREDNSVVTWGYYSCGGDSSSVSDKLHDVVAISDIYSNDSQERIFNGTDSNDNLTGSYTSDILWGNGGNDILVAMGGNDLAFGGIGNDLFTGGEGEGDDTYVGGEGVDRVKYTSALAGITVDLAEGTACSTDGNNAAAIGSDVLIDIEHVIAGNFNDILIGNASANSLEGGAGDDWLRGGEGADILDGGIGSDTSDYSEKAVALMVMLDNAVDATVMVGGVAEDSIRNIENLIGGSGNDTLIGDSADNLFRGGAGNETLDGGIGLDTADYSDKTEAVSVTLNGSVDALVTVGGVAEDTIRNIENLIGGSGNDTFIGDAMANNFSGGTGDDTLQGGAGNDTLDGGFDDDTMLFSGNLAEYSISYDFDNETYTVTDSLSDRDGSDLVIGAEFFQFADGVHPVADLIDIVPPYLQAITPSAYATNVAVGADIFFTFTEPVKAGTGDIVISNGTDTRTISVTDTTQVSISGITVTINPTANLNSGNSYNIQMVSGVIKDLAGNAYAGISNATMLNFATEVINNAPASTDGIIATDEDTAKVLSLTDFGTYSDAEASALTKVQITMLESAGALQYHDGVSWTDVTLNQEITATDIAAGKLRFEPVANANGSAYATLGYKVSDGLLYSTNAYTLTVNVTALNDVSTVSGPLAITVAEGDSSVSLNLLANAHDVDLIDMLSVGSVSYTVNGVASALPSGITMKGTTLTIDPGNTPYSAMAQGEQKTIVATYQVLDSAAETSIATNVDYATGATPHSVTSADLDGDGKSDLIVANHGSNTVSVLLNHGDGTFTTKVDYATGSGAYSVTSVDVNGDGKFDLIVANDGSNTVSVLQNSGDGTFVTKVDYATGTAPHSVTSADVNGDGKSDLIVANALGNTVSVLQNNGDGTFATKVDYVTGNSPFSVTSADVNGDGKTDLIVANTSSNSVSVLMNNGDGTFAPKVDYATGNSPYSVTSADVNGDAKPDLIAANEFSDTVSVLKNNGDGTFAAKVDYATGSYPVSVTSVDVNGDGKCDLIVANWESDTVSVLMNHGDGTFVTKIDYVTGYYPLSVTSVDVNGDGKSDLIAANSMTSNTVSVLINNSTFSAYPTTTATITINGTNDAPLVDATDVAGSVTELLTPIGNLTDSGTINFTDADLADSHSISSVTPSVGALGTLTPTITTDTTGTGLGGAITWNYSVAASAVEYLAAGEHKVETLTFSLLDGHGGSVERTVDVTITGTGDVPSVDLTGSVTFWKTGAPIAGVTSTLTTEHASPGVQSVEFRNIQIAADGTRTIEIWENSITTEIANLQLEFSFSTGSIATWQDAATLPSGWSSMVNTGIPGQFILGGIGTTALSAGPVKLGTLTLTAPANLQHFDLSLNSGELGNDVVPHFGIASEGMVTGADGLYQHHALAVETCTLASTKASGVAESNAIKSSDALAALRIAVAMNPNSDGGEISPYQYLAADINKDGQIKAADALNILKMAVKLDTAPEKEWLFVPESVASESMSRTHVVWPDNPIPVTLDLDHDLHLIGIVMGDVNGSWVA